MGKLRRGSGRVDEGGGNEWGAGIVVGGGRSSWGKME